MRLSRPRQLKTLQHGASLLAVALLICVNMVHLHVRYCLDGDNPGFTLHVETESAHSDHSHEETNADLESEFSIDTLLSKVFDGSINFHVARDFSFSSGQEAPPSPAGWYNIRFITNSPSNLFPPLRAPPA